MLATPKFLIFLRIAQFALAIILLGLTAYGVTFIAFDGDSLMLFTSLATMIIVGYILASEMLVTGLYNYWAILGLDIFAMIFWLISFALLASEVAAFSIIDYCYGYYCYKKRDFSDLSKRATTNPHTYRNAMAAASGLGALEFILFIITLVFTALALHRHRLNGGHCMPGRMGTGPNTTAAKTDVELQQQQHNGQYQQQPVQGGYPNTGNATYTQQQNSGYGANGGYAQPQPEMTRTEYTQQGQPQPMMQEQYPHPVQGHGPVV